MRTRGESGTALIEFSWLAIVLLLPFIYIMIAVFDVQRASYGVSAASQSAAQAFVSSSSVDTAFVRANTTARLTLRDHSVSPADIRVECRPSARACLEPGSSVRVTVVARQPLPLTPRILGEQLAAVTVDASHIEPYGTYREGKP